MQIFKNIEMEQMIKTLEPLLDRTDIIGYVAARNTRILRTETTEYASLRDELVCKYGEPEKDENGRDTGRYALAFNSPNWKDYEKEVTEWAMVEHEVNLMKLHPEDVIGKLSGSQILKLEWMIEGDM